MAFKHKKALQGLNFMNKKEKEVHNRCHRTAEWVICRLNHLSKFKSLEEEREFTPLLYEFVFNNPDMVGSYYMEWSEHMIKNVIGRFKA
ncbi:hypothetical protein GCM10028819_50050 [Spirosoma humi]